MANDKREIGPVTTATTGGAALVGILAWGAEAFAHVEIPVEVQGYATVLVVLIAGYLVKPGTGKRIAE